MRRFLAPLVGAVLLGMATPALAAPSASVTSPVPGSTVEGETPVTIRVSGSGESASQVSVRLSADGRTDAANSRAVSASCLSGCGTANSTWQAQNFIPATGAPFDAGQVCNGYWWIQPSVNGGAYGAGTQFTLTVQPDAPSGFVAEVIDHASGGAVQLSWNRTTQPDHAGYAIERSRNGGPFLQIIQLDASTGSYIDAGLSAGGYDYRVLSLRPDGVVNGTPAAPCADTEPDLATPSLTRRAVVQQTDSSPQPDPEASPNPTTSSSPGTTASDDNGTGGSTDGSTGNGSTGSGSTGGSGTGGSADGDTSEGSSSGSTSSTSGGSTAASGGRQPVAAPPRALTSTAQASAPAVAAPRSAGSVESYYGEGEEFSEEIDYGATEGVALADEGDDGPREIISSRFIPGGVADFVNGTALDPDKMRVLAAGLLLLTLAMHGRRWLHAGK